MLSKIKNSFKTLTDSIFKTTLDTFCMVENGVSGTPLLVGGDGSLCTIIRIDGVKKLIGEKDLPIVIDNMTTKLSSYFDSPGHAMQVWFARDPDGSLELIRRLNKPARSVADSLNLDLGDLFDEREAHLTKYITQEDSFIALWTRPSILSTVEMKNFKEDTKVPALWPKAVDAPNLFRTSATLRTRHESFYKSFVSDLKELNIRCAVLEAHAALNSLRGSIYLILMDLLGACSRGDYKFPSESEVGGNDVAIYLHHVLVNKYSLMVQST